MNRTDRLYAIVEHLRSRAPRSVRASDLAARFEVSTRTIERDLLALQESGVPISAQPGPGGGYSLDPAGTLPPLNFTPAEAVAIATALNAAGQIPFSAAARNALDKLVAAMGNTSRQDARALAERVRLAPSARPSAPGAVSGVLEGALLRSVAIELDYRARDGRESTRVVEPAAVFATANGWYLLAWCRTRQGARSFRLDRIVRARELPERIEPRPLQGLLAALPFETQIAPLP
ncbi:MAG: helix-turn-helix transcriptional regulator [Hyphomicrobiales bacterium]